MGYAKMGFEALLEKFGGYIWTVASNCAGRDRLNDREDIINMLNLVLWECSKAYTDVDEIEFNKRFKRSVCNEMASLMASKHVECSETMLSMSEGTGMSILKSKHNKMSDYIPKEELTDKHYQEGIMDILENVSPKTASVVLEVMRQENRGRFIKGSKQAYGEIKRFLQG